jgi:hypothetical protein
LRYSGFDAAEIARWAASLSGIEVDAIGLQSKKSFSVQARIAPGHWASRDLTLSLYA